MQRFSTKTQVLGLVGWLVVVFIAAGVGSVASIEAVSFYNQLAQPSWGPPASAFGPVWSVLYVLMALAAWLVWREGGFAAHRRALGVFVLQLVFNALVTWLFFAWRQGALAMVDIALVWVLIVVCIVLFWRARPLAGWLLVPYLAWTTFAGVLNYTVWQLNPQALG